MSRSESSKANDFASIHSWSHVLFTFLMPFKTEAFTDFLVFSSTYKHAILVLSFNINFDLSLVLAQRVTLHAYWRGGGTGKG